HDGAAVASAFVAGVSAPAGVPVVAGCAVGLDWIGPETDRGIADAGLVALVARRALDRIGASAHAREAGVGLGAGVAVVARGAVGLRRLRAVGAATRLGGAHAGF